jgi:hypothetical protein
MPAGAIMNMLALRQVQQGLFGKLANDGVLMGMLTAIFDQVPERTQYPYIVIGDGNAQPLATPVQLGTNVRLRMRVFSRKPGRKEALLIMDRVYGLLHHGTLTLAESETLSIRITEASTQLLADGKTIEGTLNAELLVGEVEAVI